MRWIEWNFWMIDINRVVICVLILVVRVFVRVVCALVILVLIRRDWICCHIGIHSVCESSFLLIDLLYVFCILSNRVVPRDDNFVTPEVIVCACCRNDVLTRVEDCRRNVCWHFLRIVCWIFCPAMVIDSYDWIFVFVTLIELPPLFR